MAVYRDYAEGNMTIDIGFPVNEDALALASGAVAAGATPSGKACKTVHEASTRVSGDPCCTGGTFQGPGQVMPAQASEVYVTDPEERLKTS
jgi:hypothetical protein